MGGACDMRVVGFMGEVCDVGVAWVVLSVKNIHGLFFSWPFSTFLIWVWVKSDLTVILEMGGVCVGGVIQ